MFNIHLPEPIYEHLPKFYILLAILLALTPMGGSKWWMVAALVVASVWIKRRRREYRQMIQLQELKRLARGYRQRRSETDSSVWVV